MKKTLFVGAILSAGLLACSTFAATTTSSTTLSHSVPNFGVITVSSSGNILSNAELGIDEAKLKTMSEGEKQKYIDSRLQAYFESKGVAVMGTGIINATAVVGGAVTMASGAILSTQDLTPIDIGIDEAKLKTMNEGEKQKYIQEKMDAYLKRQGFTSGAIAMASASSITGMIAGSGSITIDASSVVPLGVKQTHTPKKPKRKSIRSVR